MTPEEVTALVERAVERAVWQAQWRLAVALLGAFSIILGAAFGILVLQLDSRLNEMRSAVDRQTEWMLTTERRVSDAEHAVLTVLPRVQSSLERVLAVFGAGDEDADEDEEPSP